MGFEVTEMSVGVGSECVGWDPSVWGTRGMCELGYEGTDGECRVG